MNLNDNENNESFMIRDVPDLTNYNSAFSFFSDIVWH